MKFWRQLLWGVNCSHQPISQMLFTIAASIVVSYYFIRKLEKYMLDHSLSLWFHYLELNKVLYHHLIQPSVIFDYSSQQTACSEEPGIQIAALIHTNQPIVCGVFVLGYTECATQMELLLGQNHLSNLPLVHLQVMKNEFEKYSYFVTL